MNPDDPPVAGPKNDPMHPVAWVRERPMPDGGTQRIMVTTMGTAEDFSSHDLRRLMLNGVAWCTGAQDAIPADGLDAIDRRWDPTPFGFGTHRRGRTPESYRHGSPWVNAAAAHMVDERNAVLTQAIADGDADAVAAVRAVRPRSVQPARLCPARSATWLGRRAGRGANWKSNFDAGGLPLGGPADGCPRRHRRRRAEDGEIPGRHDARIGSRHGLYAVTWKLVDGRWLIDRNVIISAKQ